MEAHKESGEGCMECNHVFTPGSEKACVNCQDKLSDEITVYLEK